MKIQEIGTKVVWDFNPRQDRVVTLSSRIAMLAQYPARREKPMMFLCIGTDTIVGDVLGPLVGTNLKKMLGSDLQVWGTLEHPVDATNVQQTVEELREEFPDAFVIAVDASFSPFEERKGLVTLSIGGLQPGAGTGKDFPEVGDFAIRGIVAGGSNASLLDSNIRLADITVQADFIAKSLYRAQQSLISKSNYRQVAV